MGVLGHGFGFKRSQGVSKCAINVETFHLKTSPDALAIKVLHLASNVDRKPKALSPKPTSPPSCPLLCLKYPVGLHHRALGGSW